ncbi:MAG: hypothetical protein JSW22_05350 [Chloroflexota bacterium]|jgi:hypothetical protein|nr:MAG: hypothetical protein JSW22_05350 [Chloroflexota bacterium]
MATKRYYILINMTEEACKNGYQHVLRSLIAMPWVQSIERLDGIFDLMVHVENPVMVGYTAADDLLTKRWVKSLQVLQVEPAEPAEIMTPRVAELIARA